MSALLRERPQARIWRLVWRLRVLSLVLLLVGVAGVCVWIAYESTRALERKLNGYGGPPRVGKSAVVRALDWVGEAGIFLLNALPYGLLALAITCAVLGLVAERVPLSPGEPIKGADARGLGWAGLVASIVIAGCLLAYHSLN